MRAAVIAMIQFYRRWISPLLGTHCRFYPSCSTYATEAIETHGVIRGGGYTAWRLLRCHPWCAGGIDLVPPRKPSELHYG